MPTKDRSILFTQIALVLILCLAFCIYFNSLNGGFKWDDNTLIRNNPFIKSWNYSGRVFLKPLYQFPGYWRPLQIISYKLDYSFWKLDPFGYHFSNVLLHLANICLCWLFLFLSTKNRAASLLGALLFACHPALAEPVDYLSSRSDLLVGMFFLSTFIFYILFKIKKKKIFYILSLLAFLLSLLSKESALILPVVLLFFEGSTHREYKKTLAYFVVLGAFLIVKQSFLLPYKLTPFHLSFQTVLLIPKILILYTSALFFPFNIYKTWYIPSEPFLFFSDLFLPLAGIVLLIILSLKIYEISKTSFFGLCWFFITLAPFLGLAFFLNTPKTFPFSYAWLYVPSIGLLLTVTQLSAVIFRNKKGSVFPLIVIMAFGTSLFSIATIKYNQTWLGPDKDFYKTLVANNPKEGLTVYFQNTAKAYLEEGQYRKAFQLLEEALRQNPKDTIALYNMGMALTRLDQDQKALEIFLELLTIDPLNSKTMDAIGGIFLKRGFLDKALEYYQRATQINPDDPLAHYNTGLIFLKKNNVLSAIRELQIAERTDPSDFNTHYNLAILYARNNDAARALQEYQWAKEIDPNAFGS